MDSSYSIENIINQVKILCEQMPIKDNIVCLLHYGSVKQKEDFNDQSDLDFHLVLKKIDVPTLQQIKSIFSFSDKIDLSIHALEEILYKDHIIFQNGTQGLYFVHVLCSSAVLIGENIYKTIITKLDQDEVNMSLIEKMKYSIWLLRRNYIFANDLKKYKRYFIRIMKDILILEKIIDYTNIAELNNRQITHLFIEKYKTDMNSTDINLITRLPSLEDIKHPEIENYLDFFSKKVNQIVWSNL